MTRAVARFLFGVCAALACGAAAAHDTWFEKLASARGETLLALGTGNRFPLQEIAVGDEFIRLRGCRGAADARVDLAALRYADTAVVLRAALDGDASCWAELVPLDVEVAPDKIELYLNEINAPASLRELWAGRRARGLAWKERYVKSARIELGSAGPTAPAGTAMDVLIESRRDSLRAGETAVFRVLRDGVPKPGLALELRGDRSPVGLWLRTDAEGRIRVRLPLPGRWVLRGTELEPSTERPDTWDSRFVTLAFDVR